MTTPQELRQAAVLQQARDALMYWLPKCRPFSSDTQDVVCIAHNNMYDSARAALSALSAVLEAPTDEARSGSDEHTAWLGYAVLQGLTYRNGVTAVAPEKLVASRLAFSAGYHAASPLPQEGRTVFHVYHAEEYVGTFHQATFSTRERAEAYIEWCKTDTERGARFADECHISEETLDAAIAGTQGEQKP